MAKTFSRLLLAGTLLGSGCGGVEQVTRIPQPEELRPSAREFEEIPNNPSKELLDKWAQKVMQRASQAYRAQKQQPLDLACIDDDRWEMADKGRKVGIRLGGTEKLGTVSLKRTFANIDEMTSAMAEEYTAFQYLHRGHQRTPHDTRLAVLAVTEGFVAIYRAQALLQVQRAMKFERCSLRPLQAHFEAAQQVLDDIGGAQIPSVLARVGSALTPAQNKLYVLQKTVLSEAHNDTGLGDLRNICIALEAPDAQLGSVDTDVLAWCGYGNYLLGDDASRRYWDRARMTSNHPESITYTSWATKTLLKKKAKGKKAQAKDAAE